MQFMPAVVITGKLCPKNMESTVYALLAGPSRGPRALACLEPTRLFGASLPVRPHRFVGGRLPELWAAGGEDDGRLPHEAGACALRPESRNLLPFGALLSIIRTLIAIIRTRIATASTLFGGLGGLQFGIQSSESDPTLCNFDHLDTLIIIGHLALPLIAVTSPSYAPFGYSH